MKIKNIDLIKRFEKFISEAKDKRVAVLHHTDPDGVCSGVIISKVIERTRNKLIDLRIHQKSNELFVTEKTIKSMKEKKINRVIITDMAVDQQADQVMKLTEFAEVLILDHHKIYNDMNSEKIVMVKPQMIYEDVDPAHYPAAKLCFDLGSMIVNIDDLDWIAAVAVIGDFGYQDNKKWVDTVIKKYDLPREREIFHTRLGKVSSMISMTEAYDVTKVEDCYKIVYEAKSYKDVLKSKIKDYSKKVKYHIDHYISVWKDEAEFIDELDLIFYIIKPKYNIKSTISTIISTKHPNKTVIIVADIGEEFATISGRRQDYKIKVNDLLERSVKGLKDASAGGHIPAAGGRFLRGDLDKFKKNLLKELELLN